MSKDAYMQHVEKSLKSFLFELVFKRQPIPVFDDDKQRLVTQELFEYAFEKGDGFTINIESKPLVPEHNDDEDDDDDEERKVIIELSKSANLSFEFSVAPQVHIAFDATVTPDNLKQLYEKLRTMLSVFDVSYKDKVVPITEIMTIQGDFNNIFICDGVVFFGFGEDQSSYREEVCIEDIAGKNAQIKLIK